MIKQRHQGFDFGTCFPLLVSQVTPKELFISCSFPLHSTSRHLQQLVCHVRGLFQVNELMSTAQASIRSVTYPWLQVSSVTLVAYSLDLSHTLLSQRLSWKSGAFSLGILIPVYLRCVPFNCGLLPSTVPLSRGQLVFLTWLLVHLPPCRSCGNSVTNKGLGHLWGWYFGGGDRRWGVGASS